MLSVHDCVRDAPHVSLPRSEVHLVVRFGPAAKDGVDAHVFGGRHAVRRKTIRAGQTTVIARLPLGAAEAVVGVPAAELVERVVPLEELWGDRETRRFRDRLASSEPTAIVERAIAERIAGAEEPRHAGLVRVAAAKLASASVSAVALDLGVSERQLRRAFHDVAGVSPKSFAKLARFHRALDAARASRHPQWASIATTAGYYDQAHLIDDFRAITGVTPRALLTERAV